MNHHLSDTDIQQMADTRQDHSHELIAHINSCVTCKAQFDDYKLFFQSLKEVPPPLISNFFADRVLNAIEAQDGKKYIVNYRLFYACSTCIAALLMALAIYIHPSPSVTTINFQMFLTVGFLCFIFISVNGYRKNFNGEGNLGNMTL